VLYTHLTIHTSPLLVTQSFSDQNCQYWQKKTLLTPLIQWVSYMYDVEGSSPAQLITVTITWTIKSVTKLTRPYILQHLYIVCGIEVWKDWPTSHHWRRKLLLFSSSLSSEAFHQSHIYTPTLFHNLKTQETMHQISWFQLKYQFVIFCSFSILVYVFKSQLSLIASFNINILRSKRFSWICESTVLELLSLYIYALQPPSC